MAEPSRKRRKMNAFQIPAKKEVKKFYPTLQSSKGRRSNGSIEAD